MTGAVLVSRSFEVFSVFLLFEDVFLATVEVFASKDVAEVVGDAKLSINL